MVIAETVQVRLEPWGEGDFWLLRRTNEPGMTEHLGGPETEEQLARRHRRYVGPDGPGQMFRIVLEDTGETVGSIGFWESDWGHGQCWETGWGVLPEFQGRRIGASAACLIVDAARAAGGHRYLHAFPSVSHGASNAVCRRAGFELVGEVDVEYPKGRWMRSNDWRKDLNAV